jgi:7-keto-8-aminopelargonate synthetase-like enzyme
MKSNTYIFGGPVPPPYLEAISTVIDILTSESYYMLRARLDNNIERMFRGLRALDLVVLGGHSPIMSVVVGHEEEAFKAGKFLYDRGYYVQSVTFPAVPFRSAVLRIQVNANHRSEAIDGLLEVMADLKACMSLPSAQEEAAYAATELLEQEFSR